MFSVLGEERAYLLYIMLLGEIDRLVPLVQLDARVNGTLDLVRLRKDIITLKNCLNRYTSLKCTSCFEPCIETTVIKLVCVRNVLCMA